MKIDIQNGVMAIIGQTNGSVVFQVTGFNTCKSIAHLVNTFGKNCIESKIPGTYTDIIIFEYNLRGELRNPRKLLKSLRSKLVRSANTVEQEVHQEFSDLDWAMDMAATHGRGPAYK